MNQKYKTNKIASCSAPIQIPTALMFLVLWIELRRSRLDYRKFAKGPNVHPITLNLNPNSLHLNMILWKYKRKRQLVGLASTCFKCCKARTSFFHNMKLIQSLVLNFTYLVVQLAWQVYITKIYIYTWDYKILKRSLGLIIWVTIKRTIFGYVSTRNLIILFLLYVRRWRKNANPIALNLNTNSMTAQNQNIIL